ncbi:hypothetical protein Tco_0842020 [Tanacetum coccineum]|uniref:Uncharacterized protein n=1 Tax=Tanacetum coccineum TaxID=301880 RepID=A0ABQ5B1F5_9ASTR
MSPGKTSSAVLLPGKLRNAAEFVEDVAKVIAKDAHSAEKLLDKASPTKCTNGVQEYRRASVHKNDEVSIDRHQECPSEKLNLVIEEWSFCCKWTKDWLQHISDKELCITDDSGLSTMRKVHVDFTQDERHIQPPSKIKTLLLSTPSSILHMKTPKEAYDLPNICPPGKTSQSPTHSLATSTQQAFFLGGRMLEDNDSRPAKA